MPCSGRCCRCMLCQAARSTVAPLPGMRPDHIGRMSSLCVDVSMANAGLSLTDMRWTHAVSGLSYAQSITLRGVRVGPSAGSLTCLLPNR